MKKIVASWWTLSIAAALLAVVVLAFGLPLFVGALRPWWVRLILVLLVAGVWGTLAFLRVRRARKASDAIAAELAQPSAGDEESRALAARMGDALATLRSSAGRKRDYLYVKPWYVIIGPPGAGKTTALLNSGLRFPLAEQAFKGVGGTRNLDFWFADEAALVDTAGRYTTQDSDQAVDSRGWTSFLSLLKKNRPLQPINGVLVAIGVDELIRADCRGIDDHARAVRRRLVELRRTLEVAAPVYLLLTKADLLAGFTEYFDDLDVEGRRAVLGSTLPFGGGKSSAEALARAFDEMAQAVADRQPKRLFDEVDAGRRSLILGFPAQLQSLRSRLMRFMDGAFVAGDEPAGVLRGFYLTSGVQQGTPLDRILSGVADVYDRAPAAPATAGGGRAYFLNRLLTEVMFPEAGLVTMDPRARARQRTRLVAGIAAIGAVAIVTLGAWGVSFARNRSFQGETIERADAAAGVLRETGVDLREVRDSDGDLRAALPALNALRDLPQGYAAQAAGGAPLSMRFGLYQSGLAAEADAKYHDALRRIMLPRLLLRLEQQMAGASGDPLRLYEPLKMYLMLGGQGPLDKAAVKTFVTGDWANDLYPGAESEGERRALTGHLQALLDDPDMQASWAERRAPLDGNLVASSRAQLQTLSLADRAYAVMRQRAASAGAAWDIGTVLSQGDGLAFANPDQVAALRVPYFFTRAGLERFYTPALATVAQDLKRDLWVLGEDARTSGVQGEMANVRPGVAGLYARDYNAAWDAVVKTLQPGAYFTDRAALGAFTKSPSPLKLVLLEVRKNTSFKGGGQNAAMGAAQKRMAAMKVGGIGLPTGGGSTGLSASAEITNHFAQLHAFVGDGKAPAPVDDFVAAVKAAGQAVIAAKSMGGGGGSDATQAAMATAIAQVQTAAAAAPADLAPFVEAAAKGGSGAQVSAAQGAVTDAYLQSVAPACKAVAQERYPFFGGAVQDASVPDTMRLFGMGGTLDGFTQARLQPLLDTAGPVWRWKAEDPVAATLDPLVPEEFAKAAQIRDLLAGGLPLKVSVAAMGGDVAAAEFASGGTTYRFARGDTAEKPLLWSAAGGVPSADVVLFGADNQEARRVEADGPWALFRLIDKAVKENSGAQAFKATFGEGAKSVTFLIRLPTDKNPFSRGGLWSFRCPAQL